MKADAYQLLIEQAKRVSGAVLLAQPDPRISRYGISGQIADFPVEILPRKHAPGSVAEVIALANRFADAGSAPVVWYSEDAVTLVIDDDGHRVNVATLTLEKSDKFAVLCELRKTPKKYLNQKDFIRLLRIDLAETLAPGALLEVIRVLKIDNGSVVSSSVTKSKESMGAMITNKVSGAGDIPEEVTLGCPVYKTLGEREPYPIRCTVDVDLLRAEFQLLPFPDEIERAQQLAVAALAAKLDAGLDDKLPFYYGKP
jgi:hypothetical protein